MTTYLALQVQEEDGRRHGGSVVCVMLASASGDQSGHYYAVSTRFLQRHCTTKTRRCIDSRDRRKQKDPSGLAVRYWVSDIGTGYYLVSSAAGINNQRSLPPHGRFGLSSCSSPGEIRLTAISRLAPSSFKISLQIDFRSFLLSFFLLSFSSYHAPYRQCKTTTFLPVTTLAFCQVVCRRLHC